MKEKKLIARDYKCSYCGYEFKREVRFVPPKIPAGSKGKHGGGSSQVKCLRCGTFLGTWSR